MPSKIKKFHKRNLLGWGAFSIVEYELLEPNSKSKENRRVVIKFENRNGRFLNLIQESMTYKRLSNELKLRCVPQLIASHSIVEG